MGHCLVFDIGKTHIKWHVLDEKLETVAIEHEDNHAELNGLYPHFDADFIWSLFVQKIRLLAPECSISKICVTTHGAAAALINRKDKSLVLPIVDYEFSGVESINEAYNKVRPPFSQSGSPNLPAGMNLGRQLFWLQHNFPEEFQSCTDILLYPQYWVWRLTGVCTSEVSSLGCHTDLWEPHKQAFSTLVKNEGWLPKFPEVRHAWECAGRVLPEACHETGLPTNCEVFVGVHDSNASYLRYKDAMKSDAFSMISTGTWSIVMNSKGNAEALREDQDTLTNVDIWGHTFVCSRFMGGREYGIICEKLNGALDQHFDENDVSDIIESEIFCMPGWQPGSGPFPKHKPDIINPKHEAFIPAALASVYCALVLDYQLDLVGSTGKVIISGAFLKNTLLCQLLAQLRESQSVEASSDDTGTVVGAAMLSNWGKTEHHLSTKIISASKVNGLLNYRKKWQEKLQQAKRTH